MLSRNLLAALDLRCRMPIDAFRAMGDCVDTIDGPMIHIDNGGDTLAVAHLDFVDWTPPTMKGHKIYCPQLDDRLGAWIILDLLPSIGVKCDVLLTDSEEIGRSTARHFAPPKEYNWLFQFDRHGTDTVLYEYDSEANRARLETYGLTTGNGSFSDICWLSHLGVSGWNVGTGYYHEHSRRCFARLGETMENVNRFAEFWRDWQGTLIPAPRQESRQESLSLWGETEIEETDWRCNCGVYNWRNALVCWECEQPGSVTDREYLDCPDCGEGVDIRSLECDGYCRECGEDLWTEYLDRINR